MKMISKVFLTILFSATLLSSFALYSIFNHKSIIKSNQYSIRYANSNSNEDKIVYGGFHHCGIIVKDTEKSKSFYMDVFGFEDETYLRPKNLTFPGAFLKCGIHQIHLMECLNPDIDTIRPEYVGRDKHIAISINNIDYLKNNLEKYGIKYSLSSSGRKALFCRDIDQNGFEFVEIEGL